MPVGILFLDFPNWNLSVFTSRRQHESVCGFNFAQKLQDFIFCFHGHRIEIPGTPVPECDILSYVSLVHHVPLPVACVVTRTVLNYQNTEFHLKSVDLLDQFGADEKLGVACVCEDVVEQVVD